MGNDKFTNLCKINDYLISIDYNSRYISNTRHYVRPFMIYPSDAFFDIETLINASQANSILLLGNVSADFLDDYIQQKSINLKHITTSDIDSLHNIDQRFDVAIGIDLFEHLSKTKGQQVLSRLRDVLSPQYCICLPINKEQSAEAWHITDLFSFALSKVSNYEFQDLNHGSDLEQTFGLFKYNINDYKKTPDWLNADNWANPQMWGKYWW